jgi:Mrp family chromosome partitioning ATPase
MSATRNLPTASGSHRSRGSAIWCSDRTRSKARSNSLEGALQPTEHEHLRILTAGTIPAGYENLLSLGDMAATVSSLARAAEVVVFDTAAVGEEHDILLLAKHMTSVLLVAEAGRIEQRQIQETLAMLQRAGTRVVAVVLNKIRPSRFSLEYLPWSREARNRARARQRRQAHGWERTGNDALRSPGD